MSTADLTGQGRVRGAAPTAGFGAAATTAPNYHALGAFVETWVFLELFLDRCASLVSDGGPQPSSLEAKLETLEAGVRSAPLLKDFSAEISALTTDVRTLAATRETVLHNLARASLEQLGMGLFAIPSAGCAVKSAAASRRPEPSIDALHLKACDLVRRTLLLLNALETRIAG